MYPDRRSTHQRGAGLPVALFIITVLAFLVLGMAQLQQSSGEAISLQIQSQRAFFAAESGAQVAVGQVLATNNDYCSNVPATVSFTESGLSGCSATIRCSDPDYDIEGNNYVAVRITSDGQCGAGAPDEANRTVEVMVREE
ncbi:hypothetical protein ACJO2E_10660 [Marinobacter sp. M1N3S26]|uniref:hypothetical protein n=1 Tax=Marinobacter sp. M1N3S26 TaxID=3382299 RepID=UPI00387AC5A5